MMISTQTLKEIGYNNTESSRIMNMLGNALPVTTQSVTINVFRYDTEYQALKIMRFVDLDASIQLCKKRINGYDAHRRISVNVWIELKEKLEKLKDKR